ncbi:thiazole synthase [bacterium]|nr:thiazole synthase [bacterium]
MLIIDKRSFKSRLFTGTGKFQSNQMMEDALIASESELITVALKRVDLESWQDNIIEHLKIKNAHLLPNTAGVRTAEEAIFVAKMAREALQTNWIKLEIHPDPRYLMPDPIETLKAAAELVKDNFVVLPYINADPVICKRLEDVGVAAVMPLGSPIGSNQGLKTKAMLEIIIEQSNVPVIIDAGIGAPSHAAEAMEMGADAVLVNTAIAVSLNPILMAIAFKNAVIAGRQAFNAGLGSQALRASATSLTDFLGN